MKLICDLCGGELLMNAGGQCATCATCGLEYPKERLLEMLGGSASVKPEPVEEPVEKPVQRRMYYLYLKRKFNLTGAACKAGIYLDGEQCALLGARGEACVPISEGDHEIIVRIATGAGLVELEKVEFHVQDRDVYGLLFMRQTAFTAHWAFEMREHF